MHTLNGQPAFFCTKEGEIFFASRGSYNAVRLVDSVAEIHRNERTSLKTRKELFKENESKWEMGWVNVQVPNDGAMPRRQTEK
jgi:hypothetical protein